MTVGFKLLKHRTGPVETQFKQCVLPACYGDFNRAFQQQLCAGFRRFAGAHMGQGVVLIHNALNQHFHFTARGLLPQQARRYDPGIIKHQ